MVMQQHSSSSLEPFPEIVTDRSLDLPNENELSRRRRKSSGLRADPRGDTTGPALATLYDRNADAANGSYKKAHHQHPERAGRRSKRKRVKSLLKRWKSLSLRHTWFNPLIVCLAVVAFYLSFPNPSNPVHAALFLSYALPKAHDASPTTPMQYGKGRKDFAFVAFYTVVLSFTREFLMQRLLRPLAVMAGIKSRGKQARFMEQTYTAIYFAVFGPYGLYVMSRTPVWYFNTAGMYEGFPHMQHEAIFKAYYLLQASYWTQQMIVLLLMLEKPRKDFKELVLHHVVTLSLIFLSYRFHFTYMGLAVYITHDISDFFLATSKTLNYIDSPIVVPYFGFFIFAWTYLRHYINIRILLSLWPLPPLFPDHITTQINNATTSLASVVRQGSAPFSVLVPYVEVVASKFAVMFPETSNLFFSIHGQLTKSSGVAEFATVGPFTLNWATQQYKFWLSQYITFSLLAILQAVNVFWFYLIMRILWRIVASLGEVKEDERSEYDSDEEEDRQQELAEMKANEEKAMEIITSDDPLTTWVDEKLVKEESK